MKILQVGDRTEITIHQSFLGTHMMCPKMARDDAERPEGSAPSSETAIGTAMHAAIEDHLCGADEEQCQQALVDAYRIEIEHPLFKQNVPHDKALHQALACYYAWRRDLLPGVRNPASLEHKFRLHVDSRDNVDLFIGGMWDLLDDGVIVDWKTAASMHKYQQWQVDRWFIQPTMYTWALAIETDDWNPKLFKYGIVEKKAQPVGHWMTTRREAKDWMFLKEQIWSVIDSWQAPPSLNDQGWHCSPKFCASWKECKGAPRALPSSGPAGGNAPPPAAATSTHLKGIS